MVTFMDPKSIIVGLLVLLAGVLSIELGVSTAILLIIVGIISANFLDFHTIYWIDFLANLGYLGILFFAGFEIKIDLLKKYFSRNITVGSLGFLVPFFTVFFVSIFALQFEILETIILALSLSTTSLSLVYCTIRCKYPQTDVNYQLLLGSGIVIDVLSMVFFSSFIGTIDIFTFLYLGAIIILLAISPKIGDFIFQRYSRSFAEIEIKFILLLLLMISFLSSLFSLIESVFVFLLGVLFSRILKNRHVVEEKLRGLVFGFLAPLFFFKAGLLMNIFIFSYHTIFVVFILGGTAYFSKYIGTYFASKTFVERKDARKIGIFMNYRLSFALVIAVFGLTSGFITEELYISIVIITLLTSLLSSLFLRILPQENYPLA